MTISNVRTWLHVISLQIVFFLILNIFPWQICFFHQPIFLRKCRASAIKRMHHADFPVSVEVFCLTQSICPIYIENSMNSDWTHFEEIAISHKVAKISAKNIVMDYYTISPILFLSTKSTALLKLIHMCMYNNKQRR